MRESQICKICGRPAGEVDFYDEKDSYCKSCRAARVKRENRSRAGLIKKLFYNEKASSKIRGDKAPAYDLVDFQIWIEDRADIFDDLYNSWVKSDFDSGLKPSVDRLDDSKPYTLDNIQLMTWGENKAKYRRNRTKHKKAVIAKSDSEEISFESVNATAAYLGVNPTHIGRCIKSGDRIKKRWRVKFA